MKIFNKRKFWVQCGGINITPQRRWPAPSVTPTVQDGAPPPVIRPHSHQTVQHCIVTHHTVCVSFIVSVVFGCYDGYPCFSVAFLFSFWFNVIVVWQDVLLFFYIVALCLNVLFLLQTKEFPHRWIQKVLSNLKDKRISTVVTKKLYR